ncbi:MAG: hypothetical protein ACWA5A_17035 [Marinibacterium sp.]
MTATFRTLWTDIRASWKKMLLFGLAFAVLFQVFMLLALILRFQALPNYITFYDWIGSAVTVIRSTPAWSDVWPILWEEWLIEIGRMNYDYGLGISEWSLNVIPSRLLLLFLTGALVSLCLSLLRRDTCSAGASTSLRATTGFGAFLIALTNATMSWVVCCAAPSWIAGLAMLGLGVSASAALEPLGSVLTYAGFVILSGLAVFLAWRKSRPAPEPEGLSAHA